MRPPAVKREVPRRVDFWVERTVALAPAPLALDKNLNIIVFFGGGEDVCVEVEGRRVASRKPSVGEQLHNKKEKRDDVSTRQKPESSNQQKKKSKIKKIG